MTSTKPVRTLAGLLAAATLMCGLSAPMASAETGQPADQTVQAVAHTLDELTQLIETAKTKTDDEYTPIKLTAFKQALSEAETLAEHENPPAKDIASAYDKLNNAMNDTGIITGWTFNKQAVTFQDGTGETTVDNNPGDAPTLTKNSQTVTLTPDSGPAYATAGTPGGGMWTREYTGITDGETVRLTVHWQGKTVTIDKDGTPVSFTRNKDNVWTASLEDTLNDDLTAQTSRVSLSDNSGADITWNEVTLANGVWTRTGQAAGVLDTGEQWQVDATATRAWNTSVKISLARTTAEGDTETISLTDTDAASLNTEITVDPQPFSQVGDQYSLNLATGPDATAGTVTVGLGDHGTRIMTATITYKTRDNVEETRDITVTIPFKQAEKTVGNEDARLDGFQVNGEPLNGFDADTLAYTIQAGADEKVTVKPVTKPGQTVAAGDIRQTAYTTVQEWTVTGENGGTRTYTVTLVREHTEPTADEKFTPLEARDLDHNTDAPSEDTTSLKSYGWLAGDEYTPVSEDTYEIPEGGQFAYESYKGQVVNVSSGRLNGMTWQYDVGVLAPDGTHYANTTLTVTYITSDTHRAALTGIRVDGEDVTGFNPETFEYTVQVNDPDKYTITPLFDKMTGMSVSTHKNDGEHTAIITVTSADGLVKTVYTVRVEQKPLALTTLAQTGAVFGGIALLAALFALLGVGLARMARHGKPSHENSGPAADSTRGAELEPNAGEPGSNPAGPGRAV